jgi:hypothetical protein
VDPEVGDSKPLSDEKVLERFGVLTETSADELLSMEFCPIATPGVSLFAPWAI